MTRAKHPSKIRTAIRARQSQESRPSSGPFLSGSKFVLSFLLAAATAALYSPVAGYLFVVWDDRDYVTGNSDVHRGLAWSTIKWAFTSTHAANWHPLTWLSHALDYQLFALNPAGHHLHNVLLHALNAALLFLLLAWITKRTGPSLLVAALFAVHPLNVESVAWVAERKNVLSTLFFLLAVGAYVRYVQKPHWRRYLLVAGLFVAGLMAKPMVITLPFVLLLLDYWPLGRMQLEKARSNASSAIGAAQLALPQLVLEKIPLLLLSAASAWITLKTQQAAVRTTAEFSVAIRIENACVSYGLYLWKMLWPARLAALYPHAPGPLPLWQVALSALTLVGITAVVVAFRPKRYLPVGWFWFLGTLVPVLGLVQVGEAAMADRYAYLSLIGIFIIIAWTLDDWAQAHKVRTVWRVIPVLCVLAALALATLRQMDYWHSEYAVWARTLQVTEQNPGAHGRLAAALLHPDVAMTKDDLQSFDSEQSRTDEARRHYEEALRLDSQFAQQNPEAYLFPLAMILNDFGSLDGIQNRRDDQRRHYEEALQYFRQLAGRSPIKYEPHFALTLYNLANLEVREKRMDEARQHYLEALAIQSQLGQQDPGVYLADKAMTLINLGNLDVQQNRLDEARQYCEEALKIQSQLAQQNPELYLQDVAMTQYNLGTLDLQQDRTDDAREHFEQALKSYRRLAKQNPRAYKRDVNETMSILEDLSKKPSTSKNSGAATSKP